MEDLCVEIRLPLPEELPGREELDELNRVELDLMSEAEQSGSGSFAGDEFGGSEAVYVFNVSDVLRFLTLVRRVLRRNHRIRGAYAVLNPSLNDEQKIPLDGVLDRKLIRRRREGRHRCRAGDYFAVPLPDGRWGYVHYLGKEPPFGEYVQALSPITAAPSLSPVELARAAPAFPPVVTWVAGCVEHEGWRYIGHRKASNDLRLPPTRNSVTANESGRHPGTYTDWSVRIYDSPEHKIELVGSLTPEQRKLEFLRPWSGKEIALRIATGFNPDSLML